MMKIDLKDKTVLVTGGTSMIGTKVVQLLKDRGAWVVYPSHSTYDLLFNNRVAELFSQIEPNYVIHAAGWNGGIEWNKMYPATIYYRTVQMALNVLMACSKYKVKKVVSVLASCSYPGSTEEMLEEGTLWDGPPNPSVECHGSAKRTLDIFSRMLHQEYGLNAVTCVLTNCYGEGDSFHPLKTKVVSALIRKYVKATQNNDPMVTNWGSGSPKREFMYAWDAAEAIIQTLEKYEDNSRPINIGSGQEVSIKTLADTVSKIVNYIGKTVWETNKPDGQMRKLLDTSTMREILDVKITPLTRGLERSINWYEDNQESANNKDT